MKVSSAWTAFVMILACAGGGAAAPSLQVRGAAVRVVVIAEYRSDVSVTLLKAEPRFPLRISRFGGTTYIDGDVGHQVDGCPFVSGRSGVRIRGRGAFRADDLPGVVVRMPRDVHLSVDEGVFGVIGRSNNLDFASRGCGAWSIANVKNHLRITEAGPTAVRAGAAASADLSAAGLGTIAVRDVRSGLTAVSSGDGDIAVASAGGPVVIKIAGGGDVRVLAGQASDLNVSVAGSGTARYGGAAASLVSTVAGSGYVSVSKVTGSVKRQVFGSGEVQVGR